MTSAPDLRAARPDDVDSIAAVWHDAWRDGHLGHVPDALLAHRTLDQFRARVPGRLATTTVAEVGGRVVGFVTVHDDELEQLFVAAEARSSGVADALLRRGEDVIAASHPVAWLAVVAGNGRARRFYERNGWVDAGPIDYEAETDRGPVVVPCHRYEKRLVG